jgi:methionyl-tRNA formyltransferase
MGTPSFSVSFLESLVHSKHQVIAAVTQPDRPSGRGQVLTAPPVKVRSQELKIPVLQPEDLKDLDFQRKLQDFQADLFVVVAFSLLPPALLELTPYGAVNLHGSLLPKYRGAAPIQWAVINGETQTGVTVFKLSSGMDQGPILLQETLPILEDDTAEDIFNKMVPMGCAAVLKALDLIEQGSADYKLQDPSLATPAPKLKKSHGEMHWEQGAQQLHNQIRGLYPWPAAWTLFRGRSLRILKAKIALESTLSGEPGCFGLDPSGSHLLVKTGAGVLELLNLQPEGKKIQSGVEFFRGIQNRENLKFQPGV